jgi:hypothetical protein
MALGSNRTPKFDIYEEKEYLAARSDSFVIIETKKVLSIWFE